MTPTEMTRSDQEAASLADEVRAIVRTGLPVRVDRTGPLLLALPGVRARASDPDDRASRARALDAVIREELARLEDTELAEATRLLFGAEVTTAGTKLTARRLAAAEACGYEVNHFRKRIEPKLHVLVAWHLSRHSDQAAAQLQAARPVAPALHPGRGPLVLPADVFAWEAAEHQQALATLWGAVYLLRAELLQVAALISMDADRPTLQTATTTALWRHALVLHASSSYRAAYGQVLLHAATDAGPGLGPAEIAQSAGWTPELSPVQELLLVELADPEVGLADFTTALATARGGPELAATWRAALTGRPRRGTGPDQGGLPA